MTKTLTVPDTEVSDTDLTALAGPDLPPALPPSAYVGDYSIRSMLRDTDGGRTYRTAPRRTGRSNARRIAIADSRGVRR